MKQNPKDKDNTFEQQLSVRINALGKTIPTPPELSPSHIEARLAGQIPESRRSRAKSMQKLAAVACSLIVLALSVLSIYPAVGSRQDPLTAITEATEQKPVVKSRGDYTKIVSALKEVWEMNYGVWEECDGEFLGGAAMDGAEETYDAVESQASPDGESDSANRLASAVDSEQNYGETNLQVGGVDEDDIIKTDGEYIYTLTYGKKGGRRLTISRAVPAEDLHVVYSEDFEDFAPEGMYLVGDMLILTGSQLEYYEDNWYKDDWYEDDWYDGYWCSSGATEARFMDVSNPAKPELSRRFMQDGWLFTSRVTGGHLYLITQKYVYYDPDEDIDLTDLVPYTGDSAGTGGTGCIIEPVPADDIAVAERLTDSQYVVVSSLDIADMDKEAVTKSYLGGCERIYCDDNAMYVLSSTYEYFDKNNQLIKPETHSKRGRWYGYDAAYSLAFTDIVRFYLNDGQIEQNGSGRVPGYTRDQFGMDCYNGNFRIVTTVDNNAKTWKPSARFNEEDQIQTTENNLYILDENLDVQGKIEGLAPGELVYSARLMGERGYVVTFKQVDPLFALDLSDPENPKVTGQLKIPGFSEYLHPFGENMLIGIGMDADEEGMTLGLKLSLFDVRDPENPVETQALLLDDDYSEALYNHKAVLFDGTRDLLGFATERRFLMFSVSEDGFTELASLRGDGESRATYIGDNLYIMDYQKLKAYNMKNYELIKSISLH